MRIEDQVVPIEQAKKLKELGVWQDSLYSWFGDENHTVMDMGSKKHGVPASIGLHIFVLSTVPMNNQDEEHRSDTCNTSPIAAAFTIYELAKCFGGATKETELLYDTVMDRINGGNAFTLCYSPAFLANCLINLLETGRTTPEQVNQRLAA